MFGFTLDVGQKRCGKNRHNLPSALVARHVKSAGNSLTSVCFYKTRVAVKVLTQSSSRGKSSPFIRLICYHVRSTQRDSSNRRRFSTSSSQRPSLKRPPVNYSVKYTNPIQNKEHSLRGMCFSKCQGGENQSERKALGIT